MVRRCVDGVIVEKVELYRKWLVGRAEVDCELLCERAAIYKQRHGVAS